MPYRNYVALWDDKSITVVQAHNQRECKAALNELADPGRARIVEYRGPLSFELQAKFPVKRKNYPEFIGVSKEATMSSVFGDLYLSEQFSDIRLKIGDEVLPAHKVVLGARSEYFKTLIESDLNRGDEIVLASANPDVSPDDLRAMLHFIYKDQLPKTASRDPACTMFLLALSEEFSLPRMKELCQRDLASAIGVGFPDFKFCTSFPDQTKASSKDSASSNDSDETKAQDLLKMTEVSQEVLSKALDLLPICRMYSAPQLEEVVLYYLAKNSMSVKKYCMERINAAVARDDAHSPVFKTLADVLSLASDTCGKKTMVGFGSYSAHVDDGGELERLSKEHAAFREYSLVGDWKDKVDPEFGVELEYVDDFQSCSTFEFMEFVRNLVSPATADYLKRRGYVEDDSADDTGYDTKRRRLRGKCPAPRAFTDQALAKAVTTDYEAESAESSSIFARKQELQRRAEAGDAEARRMLWEGLSVPVYDEDADLDGE